MPCGGCMQRRKNFKAKTNAKRLMSEEDKEKAKAVARKAKDYYNPDNDPNYKLLRMDNATLTTKQKRIKARIKRMQARSFRKASEDIHKNK